MAAGALLAATSAPAEAHVVVEPAESPAGATQLYTLAVPTESASDTLRIEAQFPRAALVLQVAAPAGWQVTPETDSAGHILGAIWEGGRVPPGQLVQLGVLVQNPDQSGDVSLNWAIIQTFADGTEAQWIGPLTSQFPAAQSRVRGSGLRLATPEMLAAAALVCSLVALLLAALSWRRGRGVATQTSEVEADAAQHPLARG